MKGPSLSNEQEFQVLDEAGNAFTAHPDVAKIVFTSTEA